MAFKPKKKKQQWISPIVIARYPSLRTLKVFRKEGQADGKPRYECNGIVDPTDLPEVKSFLTELGKSWFPDAEFFKKPIQADKKDPEVWFIKAHSGADYLVPIFDSRGRTIPEGKDIGSGSKIRLALALTEYEQGGIPGITAYLDQVQVIEYEEPNDRSKSKFGAVEGGYEEDEDDAEEAPAAEVTSKFGALDAKSMHNF